MSASPVAAVAPSPLSQEQAVQLARLTDALDGAGLWWVSGYAAGLARGRTAQDPPLPAAHAVAAPRLTIVYGSQTGNAMRIAAGLAHSVEAAGLAVRLLRADAYPPRELTEERHLAIVISTQGDGDPPDDARGFVEHLLGKRAPRLPQLRFAVLGLGDSGYPQFCAVGRRLDERLAALGATRWFARGDADLDLDTVAAPWLQRALDEAKDALRPQPPLATVTPLRPVAAPERTYTRAHPFAAEVLANQRITGRHSARDVRHLELSLGGAGFDYEPGDALGVWPTNPPRLVEAVLAALALDGEAPATHGGRTLPLRDWLLRERELTRLSRPFLAAHATHARDATLGDLVANDAGAIARLLGQWQVVDLLRAYPGEWTAQDVVAALRPLTPRLYSIASSRKHVGDEVHLTVAHVAYARGGEPRWGAASHRLAGAAEGDALPVFLERNERFRLPQDATRDLLMIGPGTGVAPFRGFVQERVAAGARGRHWLVFGNPHAREDFLYQLEWQDALKRGGLHRLDLAFSRDQADKAYVQHRLAERGREVFAWLESGAHLYVCGATRMAKDVHAALSAIVATHGGRSPEDAESYLRRLQAEGRYARDVY